MKQYKYIGEDKQKRWRIANIVYQSYEIVDWGAVLCLVAKELIENEPTIREKIKEEDVFEKIYNEYNPNHNWLWDPEYYWLKTVIQKHLWITREEIANFVGNNIYIGYGWSIREWLEKLFRDRWLLIE